MANTLTLRHAVPSDLSAVDRLLARSYPRILARDYPPSVIVTAVPILARARPELLASGRYLVVIAGTGEVVGAGGWSGGRGGAQVRHVATDPDHLRQGIGRRLLDRVIAEVTTAGIAELECVSTLTAVPFYASLGFQVIGPVTITLRPGIDFAAVQMRRGLP